MGVEVVSLGDSAAVAALLVTSAAWAEDPVLVPGPESIPEWAQQGKFRFTRLDGGPIEVRKTMRSAWGVHFNEAEREVLSNLYTKYSERTLDLLEQAHINWVWITWSVGFSWQDEEEQREQCRGLIGRLHQRGIRAAAYVCAVSMFWESMFRDEPRSVRWITFDPTGLPYRYSGGRDPLRFIADVSNPEWLELQKRRVGAAIDAGFDALCFDNTASAAWADNASMEEFIAKIRRFIHEEKRSKLLLFTNYGLTPARATLNRNMEFVFAEGWHEPGVWGTEWNVSNIRRTKYLRGIIPAWKPLTTEYSIFRSGNRATTWMGARSQKLATAEAAAFQADYSWDMEGPFAAALMAGNPGALEAWAAIGQYSRFLREHEDLYVKARSVAPLAVLTSGGKVSFAWDREDSGLYDLLAKNGVLFDIRLVSELTEPELGAYRTVVVPASTHLTTEQQQMLRRYKGETYAVTGDARPEETLARVRALAPDAASLWVECAPHVLGTVTRLGDGKRLAVHLLNYGPEAAAEVKVRMNSGKDLAAMAPGKARLFTPDAGTAGLEPDGAGWVLNRLETYGVIVMNN